MIMPWIVRIGGRHRIVFVFRHGARTDDMCVFVDRGVTRRRVEYPITTDFIVFFKNIVSNSVLLTVFCSSDT